jgi:hypothetical protein
MFSENQKAMRALRCPVILGTQIFLICLAYYICGAIAFILVSSLLAYLTLYMSFCNLFLIRDLTLDKLQTHSISLASGS